MTIAHPGLHQIDQDGRVPLAVDGLSFSRLVAGCWRLLNQTGGDPRMVELFVENALEQGVTTFDHADLYGDYGVETAFGDLLRKRPALRRRMEIVTKCGIAPESAHWPDRRMLNLDNSAQFILASVDRSLKALGTNHIDVLLLHRPDVLTSADEIAETFATLKKSGKVRAFGVSNFLPHQFESLQSRLDEPLVTNQIEFSILASTALDDGRLSQLQRLRRPAMAWSPLSGGQLFSEEAPQAVSIRPLLDRLAAQYAVTPAAIAIAWILRLPGPVIPVLGSSDPDRFSAQSQALQVSMDRQDWYALAAASGRFIA